MSDQYDGPELRRQIYLRDRRIAVLEAALRRIAGADRSYHDKKIADDCQYCARTALKKFKLTNAPEQRIRA